MHDYKELKDLKIQEEFSTNCTRHETIYSGTHSILSSCTTQNKILKKKWGSYILFAYDNQLANEATIKKAQREIQEAAEAKTLNEKYETKHYDTKWKSVKTDCYNTLCGAAQCHSNCHMHCNLPYSIGKERFRRCNGFGGSTCKTCGHSNMDHFHECAENREVTEQQV